MRSIIRNTFLGLVFVLFTGGYLVTMIPAGASTRTTGEVVSRASRSGVTGNTGVLIVDLDSGDRISVEVPPIASVKTGDRVVLNAHNRYLIGPKYSFAGKRISGE